MIDEGGAAARRQPSVDVAGAVADHDARRQVDRPLGSCFDEHAGQRLALPLAPVGPAPRRFLEVAAFLKIALGPAVAPAQPVVRHRMLVEVLGREARIALPIEPLDLLRLRR